MTYPNAIKNAKHGNKARDKYKEELSWGDDAKTEQPTATPDGTRIHDIKHKALKKAVEVKSSLRTSKANMSTNGEIKLQIEQDAWLIKNQKWQIEWHFDLPDGVTITNGFRTLLKNAGITITGV